MSESEHAVGQEPTTQSDGMQQHPDSPASAAPELPEPTREQIHGGTYIAARYYDKLRAAYERVVELHRMQLTAIDVLALCNTHESAEKQRIDRENPYWTTALQSVYVAVDREIKERERAEAAEARVKELQAENTDMLEEIRSLCEEKRRRDAAVIEHLEARMSLTRRVVAAEAADARVKERDYQASAVVHRDKQINELHAALAALRERDEKNARRYRWLRSKANRSLMTSKKWAGQIQVVQWEDKTTCNVLKTEALDDAIDAALSRDGEGSPPDAGSKA